MEPENQYLRPHYIEALITYQSLPALMKKCLTGKTRTAVPVNYLLTKQLLRIVFSTISSTYGQHSPH